MASHIVLWLMLFVATGAATSAVYSPTYNYGFDARELARRQKQEPIIVTRLPLVNGTPSIRQEIRQVRQNPYMWNILLLSMSMLQFTPQDDELSWYQIAGIHGVPFVPWNDVQGVAGGEGRGYCTHMSILFPPWHRAYLALYEQVLFRLAGRIAGWFTNATERSAYQAAAANFRIPYWDWAMAPPEGESAFLPEFETPGIQVYGPRGWQLIANPLYSYKFRPLDPNVFSEGDFPTWTETRRAPFEAEDNRSVAHAIDNARPALQQRLFTLLSNYKDYGPFSNKYWGTATNRSQFDSVEALHDAMHVLVGDHGHMYYIQYSAFDPVFFLHHAMVDRVVALWQSLYPTSWVTPQVAMERSFTMPQGQVQDVFSDLKPFYANTSGAFWNAAMARDTLPFGYTYAETAPASGDGKPGNRAKLIASINKLYGLSSPSNLIKERARSSQQVDQFGEGSTGVSAWFKQPTHGFSKNADFASKVITGDNFYTEWIANIRVKNGALNGSFAIHLFLGEAPQEPTLWSTASNLVGSMNVFAMKNMGSGSEVSGTVPLTSALTHAISAGRLAGLDPAATEPYLRGCLEVRVAGETEAQVDVKSVTNLHIHIASAQVRAANNEWELPKWGPVTERFYFLNERPRVRGLCMTR